MKDEPPCDFCDTREMCRAELIVSVATSIGLFQGASLSRQEACARIMASVDEYVAGVLRDPNHPARKRAKKE